MNKFQRTEMQGRRTATYPCWHPQVCLAVEPLPPPPPSPTTTTTAQPPPSPPPPSPPPPSLPPRPSSAHAGSAFAGGARVGYDPRDLLLEAGEDARAGGKLPRLILMEMLLRIKDKQGYLSFWNDNISYGVDSALV
ncbi:hypothetical protein DFH09DRAFT_1464374 [Mycena vulgaris]|nr:hypothetical protein DFH09DRAFT_1464374 [Mycena vulgaris]